MKRLTKKLWFGKKRFGWGSRPVSPEGWLVTLLFVLIVIWDAEYFHNSPLGITIFLVAIILFIATARLTGEPFGSEWLDKRKKK